MLEFIVKFKDNAYIEILGDSTDDNEYLVEFINTNKNEVEFSKNVNVNHWLSLPLDPEKNILIRVILNNQILFERNQSQKFNKVYIKFGSKALGDNIAWIPYVEEYKKIHNVEIILYTPFNDIFDKVYSDIEFTNISDPKKFNDVDKKFKVDYGPELYFLNDILSPESWYLDNKNYDNCVEYYDYRKHSLQSIASLVLGLEHREIKPKVNIPENIPPKIKGKYVIVAIQSTAQLKYWNNPFGWERLFDFLNRNGYKVVLIDKFKKYGINGYINQAPKSKNLIDKTGNISLLDRIIDIKNADMMITISSGLAWLAWAVGTPVIMISGCTKPWNEFQSNNIRLYNPNVCSGCWNDVSITFEPLNWLFCPHKMDFICSKAIQPKDVIDAVKTLMK